MTVVLGASWWQDGGGGAPELSLPSRVVPSSRNFRGITCRELPPGAAGSRGSCAHPLLSHPVLVCPGSSFVVLLRHPHILSRRRGGLVAGRVGSVPPGLKLSYVGIPKGELEEEAAAQSRWGRGF